MPRSEATLDSPDWTTLYATAEAQAGHFTTTQAAEAGYSPQLLHKYLASARITRVRRGIYRLVHFPASEHEDLVVLWLWSEHVGVFSHATALALHDLSDVLPAKVHMTLPPAWRRRRLRVPQGLVLHHADIDARDRAWLDALPLTSPQRTLRDCIDAHLSPELVEQAIQQARERGLIPAKQASRFTALLEQSMMDARWPCAATRRPSRSSRRSSSA